MILDWNFHLSLLEYLDYLLPFALFYFFIRALLQGQKLGVVWWNIWGLGHDNTYIYLFSLFDFQDGKNNPKRCQKQKML